MLREDRIRLQHMLDAAREGLSFVHSVTKEELWQDRMRLLSVIKDIEIIGEAANKVSVVTKEQCSNLPWMDIIGMRNRLIHGYFDVDIDVVWRTIVEDLPLLNVGLEASLGEKQ